MSSDIKFDDKGIGEALNRGRFIVPVHQRAYKWEDDHVDMLIADIETAVSPYFMGAMVFTQNAKKADTLDIADGQQRLATVTILISAIRDRMIEIGASDTSINDVETKYLFEYDDAADAMRPRLSLNVDDNTFFHEHVLLRPNKPARQQSKPNKKHLSNEHIMKAAIKARAHVEKITSTPRQSDQVAKLRDLLTTLRDSIRVVLVIVDDPARAYTIFETLNDRGIRLSQLDLMKVFLYSQADLGGRLDEMRNRWDSMVAALETTTDEENTVDYVRHLWMTSHGHVRKEYVFKQIRSEMGTPTKALAFAGDLDDNTSPYLALMNPIHPLWDKPGHSEKIRDRVRILAHVLSVDRIMPLLLSVVQRFKAKDIEIAFQLCISWWVRFMVVGGLGRGDVEEFYANTAKKIHDGEIKDAKVLADQMRPNAPEDRTFELAFAIHRVTKHALARYFLRAMEDRLRGIDSLMIPDADPERVDLEHIMPRRPSQEWNVDPDDVARLYKRVGNMVLMAKRINSSLKSAVFKEKRHAFKDSPMVLTAEVYETPGDDWGEQQIDARQARLAKLAVQTWTFNA